MRGELLFEYSFTNEVVLDELSRSSQLNLLFSRYIRLLTFSQVC